ncbi:electron transporter RnfD [Ruminococcus sp.]|uniref:electron transporter RnfD n=1 Tax=Ruminococcus sp. TaxID=41978 RepID=UPI002624D48B|nr:electron transporter RnfD [Ruminococcus sp.]MDD7556847.1 electron transporter RnfD [Ruminococcus sp.]
MRTWISPADPLLQYMGRIDRSQAEAPGFCYAGSQVRLGFTGDKLAVTVRNTRFYNRIQLGYWLDGREGVLDLADTPEPQRLEIPVLQSRPLHRLILFKRQDATHYFRLLGFELAEGACACPLPPLPDRRIECYGDSVSAGAICEAYEAVGQTDPPEKCDGTADNAWYSFSMQTARLLEAQIHNIAQGGVALLDHTGYYHDGQIGMESVYDKLCYIPEADTGVTSWDFSAYTPQVVILAFGQNDHHIGDRDNILLTGQRRTVWKKRYLELLEDLMHRYPRAVFILTLTVLQHDADFERVLDEVQEAAGSDRVLRYRFRRTGTGTPGHPRVPEQAEMASELTQFILSLGDQIWA